MAKIYENFENVAEEVKAKVPQISYKYRNWELDNHRSILTNNKIWFAHPKNLNDPYDIRIPVRFNYDEIYNPLFLEKLKVLGREKLYWIDPNSREFRVLIENRFELIKQNPEAYFEENYLNLRNSYAYDRVGVFSLTENCLDETMWAYYGKNSEGFCIGFDTVGLLRSFPLSFGFAQYNDSPPLHSFIKSIEEK